MTTPTVSVCLLTFNHGKYIRDCVMSVVAQAQDVPLEILIGDDQSEDDTSAIVTTLAGSYPDIIKHYLRPVRLGSAANYQALVRQASGKYIATLDGDDFWLPGKLRAQVNFLDKNTDCMAVYSNAIVIDEDQHILGVFNNMQPEKYDVNGLLRRGNFLNNSSIVFRATMRESLLKFSVPYLDYKAHLHFALRGPVGYLNQVFTGYRHASRTSMVARSNESVREWYWQALMEVPRDQVDDEAFVQSMADFLRKAIFHAVKIRSPRLALKWMKRASREARGDAPRMLWFTGCSIARTTVRELLVWFSARLSGNTLKVFHHR